MDTVLILYTEVMGYTFASIKRLVEMHPVQVHLIGWDTQKQTPYRFQPVDHVVYIGKSGFKSRHEILEYATAITPKIVLISGWMDKDYLYVAKKLRRNGIRIVSFCDNQWTGSLKQWMARSIAPFFLRMNFDYLWVSGKKQYEFARKMGFPSSRVLFGFCPADVDCFEEIRVERNRRIQEVQYPKRIVYLGRFVEAKGLDVLLDVFIHNREKWKGWTLTLIGNGPLKEVMQKKSGQITQIEIQDFKQPGMLKDDFINTGIFVLPSRNEPWGVVVHEFAAAGVPLITSDVCGASSEFLEDGKNGFVFQSGSAVDLEEKLNRLIFLPESQKIAMGNYSFLLSRRYTPTTWADTVFRLLQLKPVEL